MANASSADDEFVPAQLAPELRPQLACPLSHRTWARSVDGHHADNWPATFVLPCLGMFPRTGPFSVRLFSTALFVLLVFFSCSPSRNRPLPPSATPPAVAVLSAEQPSVEQPATPRAAFFSGEIVYRRTAVPRSKQASPFGLGDFHYFISGAHWKHVDANGRTTALYDPATNFIHYYGSQHRKVDASQVVDTARFELLAETKVVLGRTCKAFRQVSGAESFIAFYDPNLAVDPGLYENHRLGHWNELLAFTGGGLALWTKTDSPEGDIISEAIAIRPMSFDASFWAIPAEQGVDGVLAPE